ncbi:MAG: hypothetical protein KIT31_29270 [Deltaproteobacteria bacterium]|nr:hypothetical protein [Deltaproteobacteria bacterium]
MMIKRFSMATLAAGLASASLGATDCGAITRDANFDLWCGEGLCVWKVVRGEARRAPTWHASDSGVELVGDDAAISQLTPVNSNDTHCIRFDLVADVEENAEAFLLTDVENDGVIDQRDRIPTSRFKPVSFLMAIKPPFDGIRFEIAKRGPGRAVFAQIEAHVSGECEGLPMIEIGPRPNGAACETGGDCLSELCTAAAIAPAPGNVTGKVCAACDRGAPGGACVAGEVCGYADPRSPILAGFSSCVPAASRELAEQCVVDGECASGVCDHGVCSGCRVDGPACANGQTCSWAWGELATHLGPSVCGPGAGALAAGEPCGTHADCASGTCRGPERKECSDGRPCASPANCPVTSGLAPGACTSVGIQGGTCQ